MICVNVVNEYVLKVYLFYFEFCSSSSAHPLTRPRFAPPPGLLRRSVQGGKYSFANQCPLRWHVGRFFWLLSAPSTSPHKRNAVGRHRTETPRHGPKVPPAETTLTCATCPRGFTMRQSLLSARKDSKGTRHNWDLEFSAVYDARCLTATIIALTKFLSLKIAKRARPYHKPRGLSNP